MTRPLLVVAHEATRTGSPRVLIDVMRHVGPRLGRPVAVRLLASGPLDAEIRSLADAPDHAEEPALVLVNSAAAVGELANLRGAAPVLAYVHEEGEALDTLPDTTKELLIGRVDRIIAVSERSASDLATLGVDRTKIVVVPPPVSVATLPTGAQIAEARASIGLADGDRLVVACGEAGWRKGADLFTAMAQRVAEGDPDVSFLWIGRRPRAFSRMLDHDTRATGLATRLRWYGEIDDPAPLLAAAHVVVAPSREDPQPLVPLEAALVGTPTIGFAVGGLSDLDRDGAAFTVPFPDTGALAAKVLELLHDPGLGHDRVERARGRIEAEQSITVVGDRVLAELLALGARARADVDDDADRTSGLVG